MILIAQRISSVGLLLTCKLNIQAQPDVPAPAYAANTLMPTATQHTYVHTKRPSPFFTYYRIMRTSKLQLPSPTGSGTSGSSECILYEDRIYDLILKKLGIGIRLSNRYPYGSILPSLRTFPIVPFMFEIEDFFRKASLLDVQKALATGSLHPYTEEEDGTNLLHVRLPKAQNSLPQTLPDSCIPPFSFAPFLYPLLTPAVPPTRLPSASTASTSRPTCLH